MPLRTGTAPQVLTCSRPFFCVALAFIAACALPQTHASGECAFLDGGLHARDVASAKAGGAQELVVGVLGITGEEETYEKWDATFSTYLTASAGASMNQTFRMIHLNFENIFQAVELSCVDIIFTNPSLHACLELEFGISAFATLVNDRNGQELDKYYGTIFTRSERDDISGLEDIRDKIVDAVSISGPGACQLQMHELMANGLDLMTDSAQIRFSGNQKLIVTDVVEGRADVGLVRTGLIEGMAAEGAVSMDDIKWIGEKTDSDYPFPHSTSLHAPEWPVSGLPHLDADVIQSISLALFGLQPSDPAAVQGKYARWRPPLSYHGMFQMLNSLGFVRDGACLRSSNTHDLITCPFGYFKVSEQQMESRCEIKASEDSKYTCPEGYSCVCSPCQEAPKDQLVLMIKGGMDANIDNSSERPIQCTPMETCATLHTKQTVNFSLQDAWYDVRQAMGVAPVIQAYYRYWMLEGSADGTNVVDVEEPGSLDAEWQIAEATVGLKGRFDFELSFGRAGSVVMQAEIRPKTILDINSPGFSSTTFSVLLQVEDVPCDHPEKVLDHTTGSCICPTGTTVKAPGRANPVANTPPSAVSTYCQHLSQEDGDLCTVVGQSNLTVVIISVVFTLLPFVLLAVLAFWCVLSSRGERFWKIDRKELDFGNGQPEVVGRGLCGPVVKGTFRGTPVAVKRAIPLTGPGGQSDRTFARRMRSGVSKASRRRSRSAAEVQTTILTVVRPAPGPARLEEISPMTTSAWQDDPELGSLPYKQGTGKSTPLLRSKSLEAFSPKLADRFPFLSSSYWRLRRSSSRAFVADAKRLCYMRHPNVTTVMGAVADRLGEPLVVMEYMEHGSLHDLLRNDSVKLEADMLIQIARDIAGGMEFLHSSTPPMRHCNLKTGNVLIDSTLRAKLSDFGMEMRSVADATGFAGSPLSLAPEILNGGSTSCEGDVYAMGILLFELFTSSQPYAGLAPSTVTKQVQNLKAATPFRPQFPAGIPESVKTLVEQCWAPHPEDRPTFSDISRSMQMWEVSMIDTYLKKRRGVAVQAKAQRVEHLSKNEILNKVFPPHVALALAKGEKVQPEHRDCVTIFFSDIVGYTDMSREMQAVDVMDMLDRLYNKLDDLCNHHHIFKVETIGDAYMAVANLANCQTDHAARIARFATEAVAAARTVQVKSDDPSKGCVSIRVGFHSGPVVASVVGNLNPRYCLFGDTVNTASRMESNSEPNRIHCSEISAILAQAVVCLTQSDKRLDLLPRGEISVKGKGLMRTFWVSPPGESVEITEAIQ